MLFHNQDGMAMICFVPIDLFNFNRIRIMVVQYNGGMNWHCSINGNIGIVLYFKSKFSAFLPKIYYKWKMIWNFLNVKVKL